VSQLDVLRAQQLVAQAEMQLFDAQSGIEDARDALRFVMGRTANEDFEVQGTIEPPDATPLDVERAVSLALSNRLDLKSRAAANADAVDQLRFARNQLLPQVDVNFALTRRRTSSTFGGSFRLDGYQFATFFTIAMPVDRTAQQVSFQTAMLDRGRRARELSTLERQIANDVRSAIRERGRLLRNLAAADTSIAIRRTEVEVAQFRYDRGLSNNLDVVTAESSLLMAESQRIQALADSAVATLRLRALLGVLSPRTDVGRSPAPLPATLTVARGPGSAVP
jgi:outer membrane protein TolC